MSSSPPPGYRGARLPRTDVVARTWVVIVVLLFIAMFVLAFFGFPSSVGIGASPTPLPSAPAASTPASANPSGSARASRTAKPSRTPRASPSS